MNSENLYVPESIWRQLKQPPKVISIATKHGKIIKNLAVDETGRILGEVVGGHEGIAHCDYLLAINCDEISAIRVQDGLLGWLKLTGWKKQLSR